MKLRKIGKKGVFDGMSNLAIGAVVLGITLVVALLIMSGVKANTTVSADGNATAATNSVLTAMATIPGWVGLVVLVAIGALLIFLVRRFG